MANKVITALAVFALALVGCAIVADSGDEGFDAAGGELTVVYTGIIDPADLTAMGIDADKVTYKAKVVYEPTSYTEMKAFEILDPFITGDKVVVAGTALATVDVDKLKKAVEDFCGDVTTEVKFAAGADKIVVVVNEKDVQKMIDAAVVLAVAEKDAVIAEKDAAIVEKDKAIADKDAVIADKDKAIADKDKEIADLKDKIAELEKEPTPFLQTGAGICVVIILAIIVLLIVYIAYEKGFITLPTKKGGKTE